MVDMVNRLSVLNEWPVHFITAKCDVRIRYRFLYSSLPFFISSVSL
jgi:hypothetical protein